MPTSNRSFESMDSPTPPSHAVVQRIAAVHNVERLTPDVVVLQLSPPEGTAINYEAGQFIAIHLPGGAIRCYSMARRQKLGTPLEFHIRIQPNGVFSRWLIEALTNSETSDRTLLISGPFGECTWRDQQSAGSMTIMLGSGTGIAPLAALVEEGLAKGSPGPIVLYWGGRQANDFYCASRFETLALHHDNFRFVPVVDTTEPSWRGRRGFVQDCAAADFPSLKTANVYACGSPLMVSSARQTLVTQCGLDPDRFYADAFEPTGSVLDGVSIKPRIRAQLRLADGREEALMLATGVSLMSALRAQGLMQGICGGQKSCGSCRIEIDAIWPTRIPPPDRVEARLLAALNDPLPADRLACQIALTSELEGLRFAIPDRPL